MTAQLPATTHLPNDPEKLRAIAAERLEQLTDQQRTFAVAFAGGMSPTEAALEAKYSEHSAQDLGQRLRKHPAIAAAVAALTALRAAQVSFEAHDVCRLLEQSLGVTVEDVLLRNAAAQVVGLRQNLSAAEHLRIKKLEARVRRSAKGERAHVVSLNVELHSPLEIVDRLAKLRGWSGDSGVSINIAALGETRVSAAPTLDPLLAELADAVLTDTELRRFVRVDSAGQRELLRGAIERLRRLAA